MEMTRTHVFDAPIDKVWAMFTNKDSHIAKFESMGHRDIEVLDYEADDDHVRIKIRRVVTIDVPGFAKKVLKPTNTVTSVDEWRARGDGSYAGEYSAETGNPVHISGTTLIRPEGDDKTHYEVTVSIKVNVPLIGGKISNFAKGDVEKQMQAEFACGDRWLAEHP